MKRHRTAGGQGKRMRGLLGICLGLHQVLAAQALKADYDFILDLGLVQQYRASLFIEADRSYFEWGPARMLQPEGDEREFHVQYAVTDSVGQFNMADLHTGHQYSAVADFDGSTRILREPALAVDWVISGETRQIGPYRCSRARAHFRGRDYEAWFTPEVPTRFGPWKLHGLPGLIVRLNDDENRAVLRLVSLQPAGGIPEFDPSGREFIELTRYRELLYRRGSDLIRRIQSKMPRGAYVEITDRQDLERFDR